MTESFGPRHLRKRCRRAATRLILERLYRWAHLRRFDQVAKTHPRSHRLDSNLRKRDNWRLSKRGTTLPKSQTPSVDIPIGIRLPQPETHLNLIKHLVSLLPSRNCPPHRPRLFRLAYAKVSGVRFGRYRRGANLPTRNPNTSLVHD